MNVVEGANPLGSSTQVIPAREAKYERYEKRSNGEEQEAENPRRNE
jgi:hypothetical protein